MRRSIERLQGQWPTLRLVHTPVHASWLNQIEIYFSIVQRKVLTPNDFDDLNQVEQRLTAFERLYNEIAEPFAWNFTREKLNTWLARLSTHETETTPLAAQPDGTSGNQH